MPYSEIRGYLDGEGKLTQLPSKRRKKLIALAWLADRIPPEMYYTEREFNVVLNHLHTFGDPATLRREMYDYLLIDRDPDCTRYHVNPERPAPEALLERYL